MSIRTTVTLDDDVIERVKSESRRRGLSFREALNTLVRTGLAQSAAQKGRTLRVQPIDMGEPVPGLGYDCVEGLTAYAEGEEHR